MEKPNGKEKKEEDEEESSSESSASSATSSSGSDSDAPGEASGSDSDSSSSSSGSSGSDSSDSEQDPPAAPPTPAAAVQPAVNGKKRKAEVAETTTKKVKLTEEKRAPRKTKTKATGRKSNGITKIILKLPYASNRQGCDDHLLRDDHRATILENVWAMLYHRGCVINKKKEEMAALSELSKLKPFEFTNEQEVLITPIELRARVDWQVTDPDGLHVDVYLISSLGLPTFKLMKIPAGRHAIVVADTACWKERRKDIRLFPSWTFMFPYLEQHYPSLVQVKPIWRDEEVERIKAKYDQNLNHYPPCSIHEPMISYHLGTRIPPMIQFDRSSITSAISPYIRVPRL